MARDPNQAVTSREKIMRAAIKEFSEVGYHEAKISHIVANAGFSQRTFYIYYENKEAIYKEIIEYWKNGLISLFSINHNDVDHKKAIEKRWEEIFKFMYENPECTKAIYLHNPFIEEIRQELFLSLKQIMTWEQDNGLMRKNICIDVLVESHLSIFEGLAIRYLLKGKADYIFLAKQLSAIFIAGGTP